MPTIMIKVNRQYRIVPDITGVNIGGTIDKMKYIKTTIEKVLF